MSPSDQMNVLLEGLPRDLIDRAKTKGKAQAPPIPLKWIVRLLLEAYVSGTIELRS